MGVVHLGHAEIRVTDLDKSRAFFTEAMGLFESGEDEERVYLRAWQDWDHHTLILKKADHPGVEHVGWRVESSDDLRHFAGVFKEQGIDHEWLDAGHEPAQGEALRFTAPSGHIMELYSSMEGFSAEGTELASDVPSHPSKYLGKGIAPRRIDHITLLADDVESTQSWLSEVLGIKLRYYALNEQEQKTGVWMSVTNLTHDISVMTNIRQDGPRLHHLAYALDTPDEILRAGTVLAEHGVKAEWGPGKHGTSGATFLYFIEPSGNRIEVWTGSNLIFAPDWKPIAWPAEKMQKYGSNMIGLSAPKEFLFGT